MAKSLHVSDVQTVNSRFVSREFVSKDFGITVRSVDKMIASGKLKAVKIGNLVRITSESLREYIDSLPSKTDGRAA